MYKLGPDSFGSERISAPLGNVIVTKSRNFGFPPNMVNMEIKVPIERVVRIHVYWFVEFKLLFKIKFVLFEYMRTCVIDKKHIYIYTRFLDKFV